jgi:hypothetical protein
MMNLTADSEERIDQYLKEVQRNLGSLSIVEQEEILDNLRAHIYSEIENRSLGPPNPEDVESVLNDMDVPESYAVNPAEMSIEPPLKKRASRRAIIGAIILPFGFFLVLLVTPLSASTTPTSVSTWQTILGYVLLFLGLLAPFASTTLGLLGISEIRNSSERTYGMPLAVFVGLFYPIVVLDLILFIIGWTFLGDIEGWNIIPLLWLILVLVIDYFIIRTTWRAANRVK